jgi:hypothetical protein
MSPWKLSISCPPLVFYRSMQFARQRRCPYLWIDQDCINQNDAGDIEKHLQIMHRVYSESRWTVAPLSFMIPDWLNIYVLKFLEQGLPAKDERSLYIATCAIKLLHYMARDRWFKRTWILQEKQCAASLFLFVPIPPDRELPDEERLKKKFRPPLVGNDLCIELASIQRLWASRDLFADFTMKNSVSRRDTGLGFKVSG